MDILIAIIILAVVVGLLVVLKALQVFPEDSPAFVGSDVLFTPAERSFFGVLEQALSGHYRVFGKVRLADIVKPAKGMSRSKRTTAMNRICQKHVDFVICKASDLSLVGVVELDDKSHEREERAGRDRFVDQVLAMAGIPLIHFPAGKGYALQDVRVKLAVMIKPPAIHESVAPRALEGHDPIQPAIVESIRDAMTRPEPATPVCPKCASKMIKRQVTKGKLAGRWFWACSEFPVCRHVKTID